MLHVNPQKQLSFYCFQVRCFLAKAST